MMEFGAKKLAEATKNYCRTTILGKGGYGTVYKGTLRYCPVAVKVLSPVSVICVGCGWVVLLFL